MSNPHDSCPQRGDTPRPDRPVQDKPAWANGIRALYDAVTQEPLPADFEMLLNQLGKIRKD